MTDRACVRRDWDYNTSAGSFHLVYTFPFSNGGLLCYNNVHIDRIARFPAYDEEAAMICPKCGTENPDYFVYCKHCSELLPSDDPTPQQRAATKVDAYAGLDAATIERMLKEPYYDPRQRHNAIDPWQLLEEDREPGGRGFSQRLDEILPPEREYRRRSRRVNPESIVVTHTPRGAMRPVVRGRTAAIGKEKPSADEALSPAYASAQKGETEAAKSPAAAQHPSAGGEKPAARAERIAEEVPATPLNAVALEDEAPPSPLSPRGSGAVRAAEAGPSKPEGAKAAVPQKDAEAVLDDIFDDDDEAYEARRPRREKKDRAAKRPPRKEAKPAAHEEEDGEPAKSRTNMVFWVLIAVLTAALLFVSYKIVVQNYGSVGAAFASWFGGEQQPADKAEHSVSVEATEHDGMEAHTITVFGEDGLTAVFVDPATGSVLKQAVLQNGGYKLTVVDLNWIPEEAGDLSTFEVTPVIYLLDAEGNRTDLEVPAFAVNVPKTQLTVDSPDVSAPVTVESGAAALTISGSVEPGTPTRLFWEGEEYTAAIDAETGAFTIEAPLAEGKTEYTLKATLARHGDAVIPVTLNVVVSALEVSVDELPSSVTEDSLAITGRTAAGAKVTVEGPVSGEVTVGDDGAFRFTADLKDAGYGLVEYTVSAELNGRTGSAAFTLLRTPEIDAYSRKAQVFEYRTVLRNPNDSKGKIYRLDGTVQSVEKVSDFHQVVLIYVDGDRDKPVTLDYFSNSQLVEGRSYRFFADANGNTEETDTAPKMPRMNCWFAGRNG